MQNLSHIPDDWWRILHHQPRGAPITAAAFSPIMLHSRTLVIGTPRKAPLVTNGPLPPYMAKLLQALNWKTAGL